MCCRAEEIEGYVALGELALDGSLAAGRRRAAGGAGCGAARIVG